jgi:diacylglycerol kinase family enzyme
MFPASAGIVPIDQELDMKCDRRVVVVIVVVGALVGVSYALRRRRKPHLVAAPEGIVSFKHPVLIINPHSGGGKAQKIGLAAKAEHLGIETVVRKKGEKIGKLAKTAVDNGCDHLIIAGGDGSLARVAKVAIERDVPFSCVPSGTRNHFAMDLGLDRSDPAKALDTAFGGVEFEVDVGRIGKHLFLNNVSFGIYADAIAETGYREHKTESLAEATKEDLAISDTRLSVRDPEGAIHDDIGVLLASNNPYRFIGAPDFAGRARLDTGTLGVILADRTETGDIDFKHSEVKRWSAPKVTVDSTEKTVQVGIDGSLHKLHAPIDVHIDHRALRVVLPTQLVEREIEELFGPEHEALANLSHPSS